MSMPDIPNVTISSVLKPIEDSLKEILAESKKQTVLLEKIERSLDSIEINTP